MWKNLSYKSVHSAKKKETQYDSRIGKLKLNTKKKQFSKS